LFILLMKSLYNKLLQDIGPHKDYLAISNTKEWIRADEKYFTDFIERRAKLPINTKLLLQDSEETRRIAGISENASEK